MEEQHSLEWFRKRLGKITGSMVGVLMKKVVVKIFQKRQNHTSTSLQPSGP